MCAALSAGGYTSGIMPRPTASAKIDPISIAAAVVASNFPVMNPSRFSPARYRHKSAEACLGTVLAISLISGRSSISLIVLRIIEL